MRTDAGWDALILWRMRLRFLCVGILGGGVWAQDLKAPPRCTGPECAERMRMEERTPRRRVSRQAETQVDRYGYPKHRLRAERYRFSPPSPRHKVIERAEALTPHTPSVRHANRAERQRLRADRKAHRILLRAERYRPNTPTPTHRSQAEKFTLTTPKRKHRILARAEQQRPLQTRPPHKQLSELYKPPAARLRHSPQKAEKWVPALPPLRHWSYAERHRYTSPRTPHKSYPEKWAYQAPQIRHGKAGERFRVRLPTTRHRPAPQGEIYAMPRTRHRSTRQSPCEPPPIPHPSQKWTANQSCTPPTPRHSQRYQTAACRPPKIRHQQSLQIATCASPDIRHSQKHQSTTCRAPALRHSQRYQHASCREPVIAHRHPRAYDVPCDAQRRGVMTQTQRFAYDLRYLFTNHHKHCELQSAYSGVSIGEWVNTESYGRVPVAAYKMGWRTYRFAHFYDKKGHRLKKPRIEKRKVWSLYQIKVLVPQPVEGKSKKRRYIRGLPGIEGFGALGDVALEPKWLSPTETKAIQIEKLVRKRQIVWLVRAYPEEQVRLPEWIKKYAGPKPEHLWPGVDYRLLEVWQ